MLGLNSGQDLPVDLEAFVAAVQPGFPILTDARGAYIQYYQSGALSPYPLDYVIDPEGRVAYFGTEYDPEAMIAVIDELLQPTDVIGPAPGRRPGIAQLEPGALGGALLRLELPAAGRAALELFDARGRRVRTLIAGEDLADGVHVRPWDGRDDAGRTAPAGVYLALLRVDGRVATGKLTLVK